MNSRRVRSELIGQLEGVGASIFLLHPSDDEGGQVLRGLDVESAAGSHLNGSSTAGPLDVFGIAGEGACHGQDFARLDANVLWQSLNPGSRPWESEERQYMYIRALNNNTMLKGNLTLTTLKQMCVTDGSEGRSLHQGARLRQAAGAHGV